MQLLEVVGLAKAYSKKFVVNDVSFEVGSGEIVGLLGPNGAGKTTSFRMAIGMIKPTRGRVILREHDVTKLPMYKRSRRGLGYLSQEPSVFQRMTVEQNLLAILEAIGVGRRERRSRAAKLLADFGLVKLAGNMAYTLSGGERRRLEIARALIVNPSVMLLDEPFSGVDPKAVAGIQDMIRNLSERGIGILLTDHNVRETLSVTNRSYIIFEGNVLCHGTPAEIVADPRARGKYFGDQFEM